ncbi:MAG TPA: nickel-dependent lactate racemase [Candidatus Latescibacteria bacterium]|nr:nickel-dependent lactate racemase [Candidatus Latescibacterota bacterium]
MIVELKYGRRGLRVEIPAQVSCRVLRANTAGALADEEASVNASLHHPIGSRPLAEIARSRISHRHGVATASITVSDITRPVPNSLIVPQVLNVLNTAGIADEHIAVIVGTGLHRASTEQEIAEILGADVPRRCRVTSHVARNRSTLAYLGKTSRGTPIWVNREFVEADVRIAVSLIEPHFMAGFSGGRKAVCPGLAGVDTMRVLHGPEILSHPNVREGCLAGNPFHEEATEIARRAGLDFTISVTLNEQRRITGVYSGDPETAHAAGCAAAARNTTAQIPEPVDAVITTSAGYPLDLTFYQSVKAMTAALPILKKGGTLIVASSCDEGIGSPDFTELMLGTPSLKEFRDRLKDPGFFVPDQWQFQMMCRALETAQVLYFSTGIPADILAKLFVTPIASVEEGIARALERHGSGASMAIIPEGPYVMPAVFPSR